MSDQNRPEGDMMRMLADFRLPGLPDMETLAAAQRRNMEALSAANRVALEGAQTVARRHMEIVQSAMSEMSDVMRTLATQEPPQAKATKQAELMKAAYEKAVANMRELAELIQKSNQDALAPLTRRFTEAMDEVKQLAAKTPQA